MQLMDFAPLDIVTLPPEGDENLPLGDTTKNFIRDEIKAQLDQAIDKFNPHGARRVAQFIQEWGLAGTLVAVPIALLALTGTGWYYAFNRVDKEARFQTTTDNRLQAIENQLKDIRRDLSTQSLINHAALPLSGFKADLPSLRSALASAKQQNIKASPTVMDDLGKKLAASVAAPQFWPAAADFINYRSQISILDYQQLMRPDLPNCVDKPPEPMKMTMDAETEMASRFDLAANSKGTHFTPALYENCRFTLDAPAEQSGIPEFEHRSSFVLTFRRCQIVYHGGPITLLTPHPRPTPMNGYGPTRSDVFMIVGQTIKFENCLFAFSITAAPVTDGQNLTQQLLSQNGSAITVKFPTGATHS
jgi:hypothetical protein